MLASWLRAVEQLRDGLTEFLEIARKGGDHVRKDTTDVGGNARAPNREELLKALEERQKDLEQEIADIHDVLRRLRDERATTPAEPAPSI